MKITNAIILVFVCLMSVYCLQLTSHKPSLKHNFFKPSHQGLSLYAKHYLSHRTEEYIQEVKRDNLEKIEAFNAQNKEALANKTGGHSYITDKNKFIQFTSEQFVQLFTGRLKEPDSHHHNTNVRSGNTKAHELSTSQKKQSLSQDIFDHMIASRVDLKLAHKAGQVKQHIKSHNQDDDDQYYDDEQYDDDDQDYSDEDQQLENPYEIDDSDLEDIYGDANNEDSWGWDWKSFDEHYYDDDDEDENQDYDDYWTEWQDDHWGYDKENPDQGEEKSPWYDEWEKEIDDEEYWDDQEADEQTDGGSDTDDTTDHDNGRAIAAYADDAVEINWVKLGATTHVKSQGQCGSCWAFSAVGVIESYHLITGKGTVDLSEQQLVDCHTESFGCNGGYEGLALNFVNKTGLVTEEKYPYRGKKGTCAHESGPYKIPQITKLTGRAQIEAALRKGPITTGVFADDNFQFYEKGIFDNCSGKQINHAVVLVGYTRDYWLVRNSWGADWGENGYIRIKKNQNNGNACSIQNYVNTVYA